MKRGFTLVELIVVLVVLATVAHLGVREFGRVRDQRLSQRADRQLEEIRESALEFLADTGRAVPLTNGTLSALWSRPPDIRDFAVLPATRTNLFAGASDDLVNAGVYVPVGWKGPYLRLPLGRTRLSDPWGNEFLTRERDEARRARVVSKDGRVADAVAHFGTLSLARDRRSVSLLPERGIAATLKTKVVSAGGATTLPEFVTYRWYGPCGSVITGAVKTVAAGQYAVFAGLTPGRRILCESVTGTSREVQISPGDLNLIEIRVP